MYLRKLPKFFRNSCLITFLFLLSANRAHAQDSYIIVHAHNPEGIEIAMVEGMDTTSVEIYDSDNLIGHGAYDSKTHNKPVAISPGTHDIKVKFNGITKEQTISIDPGETKLAIFTFDRTNHIDEIENKLPMNSTDSVSVSGLTDRAGRVWNETDLYAVGGDFWASSVSADISATVQGIITPLKEDNRFHMEHHLLSATSSCWNQHSPTNTTWSAGVTGFLLINQKNALTLPSTCTQWFVQGWGTTTDPLQGGISLQVGGLPASDETNQQKVSSVISHVGDGTYYMIRLNPGVYNIRGGFHQAAGTYSKTGSNNSDPGTESTTDFNSVEDIEIASSVSDVPYYFGIFVEAQTDKDLYAQNEEVKISCIVKDGFTGLPISPDNITAEVTGPDGLKEAVSLSEVATGSYEGTFSNSSLSGSYHLKIEAKKEGYKDSKAELDFTVGILEILDGADFTGGKEISDDLEKLISTTGTPVKGAVADGVTRLLLRLTLNSPSRITFSIEGGSPSEENGFLRYIGGSPGGDMVTVDTVDVNGKTYALAIYQAPNNFVRGGHNEDKQVAERTILLNVKSNDSPSFQFSTDIKLVRPPVILVHGFWSGPGMWGDFSEGLRNKLSDICIVPADYERTGTNTSHLDVNWWVPIYDIVKAKEQLRSEEKIAMVQADVIGHSMGGLLARIWAGNPEYKRKKNFYQGDINKLITIDSPHNGSFLAFSAHLLVTTSPGKTRDIVLKIAEGMHMPLDRGAIDDLMIGSDRIVSMNVTPVDIRVHAIVGDYIVFNSNINLIEDSRLRRMHKLFEWVGLGMSSNIIQGRSDLVVSLDSQIGGLSSNAKSIYGHDHMNITTQDVVNDVIFLLNSGAESSFFHKGFSE